MELPAEVLVHNSLLGLKGSKARLLDINPRGYYEVNLMFGARTHRVLLPISETVILASEAEEDSGAAIEVER